MPSVDDPAHFVKFQDAVASEFDLVDRQTVQQVVIQLGSGGPQQNLSNAPGTVWQFASHDKRWKLSLSQTSLGIETDAYSTYADFSQALERALALTAKHFPIKQKTRFGLRYINEITGDRLMEPGGLLRFFTPEFLPVGGELSETLAASYSEVRFDEADGSLVLRHGLVQPDKYLLDFDYFNESAEEFDATKIVETARSYHTVIDSIFARAITPEFMAEMKEGASA